VPCGPGHAAGSDEVGTALPGGGFSPGRAGSPVLQGGEGQHEYSAKNALPGATMNPLDSCFPEENARQAVMLIRRGYRLKIRKPPAGILARAARGAGCRTGASHGGEIATRYPTSRSLSPEEAGRIRVQESSRGFPGCLLHPGKGDEDTHAPRESRRHAGALAGAVRGGDGRPPSRRFDLEPPRWTGEGDASCRKTRPLSPPASPGCPKAAASPGRGTPPEFPSRDLIASWNVLYRV
jgi:hypothetical protein